jgi:hypothetical protein
MFIDHIPQCAIVDQKDQSNSKIAMFLISFDSSIRPYDYQLPFIHAAFMGTGVILAYD